MLLTIDAGNTNTVLALFKKDEIVANIRFSTDSKRTSDEYAVLLNQCLSLQNIDLKNISDVIISSVVPKSIFPLTQLCNKYLKIEPMIIGKSNINLGIDILIDNPKEVGADRIVNAISAYNHTKKSTIILDFGTATNFDVVDNSGNYCGGVICPGVNLSIQALHNAAAQLPDVAIEKPKKAIGKNTIEAMQSGIYWGYVDMIEGIIKRISNEMEESPEIVVTGGLSPLFCQGIQTEMEYLPNLTINGLKIIYDKNRL